MENLNLHDNNVPSKTGFNATSYTNTLKDKTKIVYLSAIAEFFGVKDLNDITIERMQEVTPETANAWAVSLLESGLKKSTINKKMSGMKNFYKFLCRRHVGIMTYNPFDTDEGAIRYKNTNPNYSTSKTLTPEDVSTMIAVAASGRGIIGLRNKIIIEVLWSTGMRREELASMTIGDIKSTSIDGKKCHVFEIIGKGDKKRSAVIEESVYADIVEYVEKRCLTMKDKGEPLFISHSVNADKTKRMTHSTIYKVVKDVAKKAGLNPDDIHPHTFRHSFATTVHKLKGLDEKELRDLMGHSSCNTTYRYIHSVDMMENSKEASSNLMSIIKNQTV